MTKMSHDALRLTLAKTRPMTSLIDKEIIAGGPDLRLCTQARVPLYVDTGHVVTDGSGAQASRAITLKGQLIWQVQVPGHVRAHHAVTSDPFAAMEEARAALPARRAARLDWSAIERAGRDLLWGRARLDLRPSDFAALPLCALARPRLEALSRRWSQTRIPGPIAALLLRIEPEMGFVIHGALQRAGGADGTAVAA